ncbi:asparaginase [Arthrobacter gengyunqii]|uniref:asparaginase n=1 Tax=Arthrobacter gengyunqii TaxID=2886940 RepID=A0ABS8GM43_9MICC|nr:asparaginase [Arthrobacter gengyunqii]MCC3267712.1 asparaginase [Arthrobacter gengyunqii]
MASIRILGTGGTIASRSAGTGGLVAEDRTDDLIRTLSRRHTVTVRDIMVSGSYLLQLSDLRTIAQAARNAVLDSTVDGVVITHGTDTMEETAFLLDLVHGSPKPVVFTGSRRPADAAAPDGPQNLEEAVEAAASPELRGTGVLVSFAGKIRSARGLFLASTVAADPFAGGTEVAHFIGDSLHVTARPLRPSPMRMPSEEFDQARVSIIDCALGTDTGLFTYAVHAGADAVVLAGTGLGNAGPGFVEAVQDAVRGGCFVVLSSRVPFGPVVPTYGAGGGVDLVRAGAIPSGDLKPSQARILAALLTSQPATPEQIHRVLTAAPGRQGGQSG